MWLKYLIIAVAFFLLAIVQISFLPYFSIGGVVPNLIFILFFIAVFFQSIGEISLWESVFSPEGFFIAGLAGFFLDMVSRDYFGVFMISCVFIGIFVKSANYFLKERENQYVLIYFLCLFVASLILFNSLASALSLHFYLQVSFTGLVEVVYNTIIAVIGFYGYAFLVKQDEYEKQLKLL